MAFRTAEPLRLVHHQKVDPCFDRLLGQMGAFGQHLQRDHGATMQVERIEVSAEVAGHVGQPLRVEQREDLVVLSPQFAQPLHGQGVGCNDEAALDSARMHEPIQDGVAPVPWTPILLARRRSPRCRSRDRRTRRHSDSRWSSWFGPDVHRESWLGSSSRRPRRYETGSRRLIATLASAPTACAPKNMRRFVGCAGRTGSCAKNAKFWQKPRPGSRGRPDPGGLPVHEHEPGSFSRRHDGPRARCLHERVLRVASTSTLSSGAG